MFTRREMIQSLGGGLGGLGLAALLAGPAGAGPHFRPRAKRVIQLFMNGGPFGPDLFDPKPAINKHAGQRPKAVELRTENQTGGLMPVPFRFAPHGRSDLPVSELLPRLARRVSAEKEVDARVALAYRLLYQRLPTAAERDLARAFLTGGGPRAWEQYAQVLLAGNELLFID